MVDRGEGKFVIGAMKDAPDTLRLYAVLADPFDTGVIRHMQIIEILAEIKAISDTERRGVGAVLGGGCLVFDLERRMTIRHEGGSLGLVPAELIRNALEHSNFSVEMPPQDPNRLSSNMNGIAIQWCREHGLIQ